MQLIHFRPRILQGFKVLNDLTNADAHLRPSILPGLLEAVRRNQANGTHDAQLFEIGSTFWYDVAGKAQEKRQLGIVGSDDLRALRGVVESLLFALDKDKTISIAPAAHKNLTSAASINWSRNNVGELGLLNKAIAQLAPVCGVNTEIIVDCVVDREQLPADCFTLFEHQSVETQFVAPSRGR